MSTSEIEWGSATPESLKAAIGNDLALKKAIDECLSEQGHPSDWELFPQCNQMLNAVTPEEMDHLVAQGRA
tara:strand:+ start:2576 stop:2788 length:213 start_codon:yes stop_codon:yes gene_type:complete